MSSQLKNETKLFQCPSCSSTPLIEFIMTNKELISEVKCNCGTNYLPLPSMEFYLTDNTRSYQKCFNCHLKNPCLYCNQCKIFICSNCSFTHNKDHHNCISDDIIRNKCIVHPKKYYKFHCYDCKVELCKQCKDQKHSNHYTKAYSDLLSEDIVNIKSKELSAHYETIRKNLYNIKVDIIERLMNVIDDINRIYKSNVSNNKLLMQYISNIIRQYKIYHKNPNYTLISNVLKNTQMNKINFDSYFYSDVFKYKEEISTFFKNNYFIKVKNQCIDLCERTKKIIKQYHTKDINCIIQLNDGRVASCSDDETINIYSSIDYSIEFTINVEKSVKSICQMNNGVIAAMSENEISFWSSNSSKKEKIFAFSPFGLISITKMIKLQNGNLLTTSEENGEIKIWSFDEKNKNKIENEMILPSRSEIVTVIEINNNIIAISQDNSLLIVDLNTKEIIKELENLNIQSKCLTKLNDKIITYDNISKVITYINAETFQIENQSKVSIGNVNLIYAYSNTVFTFYKYYIDDEKIIIQNEINSNENKSMDIDVKGALNSFEILDNGDAIAGIGNNLVIIQ